MRRSVPLEKRSGVGAACLGQGASGVIKLLHHVPRSTSFIKQESSQVILFLLVGDLPFRQLHEFVIEIHRLTLSRFQVFLSHLPDLSVVCSLPCPPLLRASSQEC